ncbi:inner membrane protein [Catalinimonas alkaloidigena]|uniref:Inner membrane protein n=1 Tax=Catalinimonas alkaloidigena TaxID=1075417 RepID=A0A1G9BMM3_9BACT|nr:metal-dependent hydrolase [Catalinimonas alkaloidigena]SDK40115.1 inner membrane protein [Catalinimonas alkaloidigena]
MRGISHLAIGITTGAAIAALSPAVPFSVTGLTVAAVSSLAPDLDHPESRISRRISFSHVYLKALICILAVGLAVYSYIHTHGEQQTLLLEISLVGVLIGAFMRETTARRFMLLFTALMLIAGGVYLGEHWLYLLGGFVGISPFTPHRSWTHTVWAVGFWLYLGDQTEKALHVPGLAWSAVAGYVSHLVADTLTKNGVKWLFPLWEGKFGFPLIRTGSKMGNFWEAMICVVYALLVFSLYR